MNTTRRDFLKTGMIATAAALSTRAAGGAEEPRWRVGLGLNGFMSSAQVFHKTYALDNVLDFARRENFHGVELVEGWPSGGYPASTDARAIASLKRPYDERGLRIYTFQNGGAGAYAADAAVRKAWLGTFRDRVRLAEALGCVFMGHWPGGDLVGNADVNQAITNLASSYREAAKMCADANMHLSFEIEPPFLFNTLEHLQRILEGANHPACKTNYDPSHFDLMSGSRGKPEEMLRALGVEHIGHVHLTDTDGTIFKGTSKHLPCGEGHCDIAASLKTLWDGGYKGWIMIDAWTTEDAYHASLSGKKAVDAFLKTVGA